jgi:hypothetical protein
MLKSILRFQTIVNEKTFDFNFDNEVPTADLKEAIFQLLKLIGQIEDHAAKQQEGKKDESLCEKNEETCI